MNKPSPVIGVGSVTLDFGFLPPSHTDSYLAVARGMVSGAKVLADAPSCAPQPLALLCCHALECILKGFLALHLTEKALMDVSIRHNLTALWASAQQHGLPLPSVPPIWLQGLSEMHDKPYDLRYAKGLNGMVFPPLKNMPMELDELLSQVHTIHRAHPAKSPN